VGLEAAGGHDVVVIGASAGGVEALSAVARKLPSDLPAAVFVVLHVSPLTPSVLPEILTRAGPLPATHAVDGEPYRHGHVYVAPPDRHLVLEQGLVRLSTGPTENGHRPAVDTLFRSVATLGPRVVAVVLSGALDDGAAGMVQVKQAGGHTIVQDPESALYPSMPQTAIEHGVPDQILHLPDIGPAIAELVTSPIVEVAAMANTSPFEEQPIGGRVQRGASGLSCPDCGGSLWEYDEAGLLRFRCRVGHQYSPESMLTQQGEALDRALWSAVRALEEKSDLAQRLSARLRNAGHEKAARRYDRQAAEAAERAALLRETVSPLEPELEGGDAHS
jgi:two-component system chemotaxis response regulator CheB